MLLAVKLRFMQSFIAISIKVSAICTFDGIC